MTAASPAELHLGLDPLGGRRQAKRVESIALVASLTVKHDIGQRGAAPEIQPCAEKLRTASRIVLGEPRAGEFLEPTRIELLVPNANEIATRRRRLDQDAQPVSGERASELRDDLVQRMRGAPVRLGTPHAPHQDFGADGSPGAEQQARQKCTLPRAADRYRLVSPQNLERPQPTELDQGAPPSVPVPLECRTPLLAAQHARLSAP